MPDIARHHLQQALDRLDFIGLQLAAIRVAEAIEALDDIASSARLAFPDDTLPDSEAPN